MAAVPMQERVAMSFVRVLFFAFFSLVGVSALALTPVSASLLFFQSGVTVVIDPTLDRHDISPLIYGVNFASGQQAGLLNLRLNRSGGNATTRYNWQQNCTSSGNDWYFFSHTEPGTAPGESVDQWVLANNGSGVPGGTKSMVTVPTIGWVAKIHPNRDPMWSFSVAKYGAQQLTEPWHPDAGNGIRLNGTFVTGNDPTDANTAVAISYQIPWLQHLISTFGLAANGGVSYYLLDNEPGLWHESHRDVMPTGIHTDELFTKSRDAAVMIKNADPGAFVCGPEEWGWLGYLYSGFDFQWLAAHNWQGNPPDRAAHGNMDLAPWMLQQFAAASATAGRRLLDGFSLHYYPQGSYGWEDVSTAAQDWRSRSTRSLWDPNYTDESWIGQKIRLIPRMKEWVAAQYPGTKLGITEYNWGADNHISGALAQADVLGILGREGVDLANRWVCPPTNSLVFKAIQMFANYDGQRATFGNTSIRCTVQDSDNFAAFATQDMPSKTVRVMLLNKSRMTAQTFQISFAGSSQWSAIKMYRLDAGNTIQLLPIPPGTRTMQPISAPPQTITLLVFGYIGSR